MVELYEVKSLLLQMRQLRKLTMEHEIGDYKEATVSRDKKKISQKVEKISFLLLRKG